MERQWQWRHVMIELKLFFARREMRDYRRRRRVVLPEVVYGTVVVDFD